MHGRVHPHVYVATIPVELEFNVGSNLRTLRIVIKDVPDIAVNVSRIDNPGTATVPTDRAGVSRLAATQRIEGGPVNKNTIPIR
jgi:hypothetical protein